MNCETCLYFKAGECHRFPPVAGFAVWSEASGSSGEYHEQIKSEPRAIWPEVEESDFCGEHKEKPDQE